MRGRTGWISKLYVFTLVVVFSILPTFIFFSINYNKEKEILFKQKAVALKQKIDNWKEDKSAQFYQEKEGVKASIIEPLEQFINHMVADGPLNYAIPQSIRLCKDFLKCNDSISECRKDENLYDDLYDKARITFDSYGNSSQAFINNGDDNNTWTFNNDAVYFTDTDEPAQIEGSITRFPDIVFNYWWLIIIFLTIILYAIYGILNSVIHNIFGLDFKDYSDKLVLHKDYIEIGDMLMSIYKKGEEQKDSFNNSFIVGVNASHVFEIHHILQKWKENNFFNIDLLELPNVMEELVNDSSNENHQEYFSNYSLKFQIPIKSLIKSRNHKHQPLIEALNDKHVRPDSTFIVFIEHFEFAYDSEHLNRVKLNILQRLASHPSIRVVISSEISPIKIYEYYEDSIKKTLAVTLNNQDNYLEIRERLENLKGDYKNWLHLLGGFYRITLPIELKEISNDNNVLQEELKHGQYLNRINYKYKELYKELDSCEDYILNVQETSYSYYYSIWNSLSKEERYIVYDIAHDKFINTNNVDGIIDLLHKGLLIYDHSLRLMNESFTNFILTKVDSDEALERELELTKRGDWNTASAVLLLVIISLIVFISFGKINILEDVNALLGSLAAIFTLLLRMSGIFIMGKSPK